MSAARAARASVLLALIAGALPAAALEPEEVLVLARSTDAGSGPLLQYYRERRGVPEANVLGLAVPEGVTIARRAFEKCVLGPLRAELARPERARIRCLLVLRGLPLRVGAADLPGADAERRASTVAAFDSEVALALRPPRSLESWAPNPLLRPGPPLAGAARRPLAPDRGLLVARLDGPTARTPYELIDRAIEGEKHGLDGLFAFDARRPRPEGRPPNAYAAYDARIHEAAAFARARGLAVALDEREALFGEGACPGTAFYVGWYSLGKYVDAFTFVPGAIGFHVASIEAESLKRGNGWVKRLVEDGVAATLGPTDEPYLASFPDPVAFLAGVLSGEETLAETYWRTVPHASWRQVLIGDPLYRPRVRPTGR